VDDRDRFETVDRLFAAVQEVPAGERASRLAELCDDESIRDEVLGLFAFDSETAAEGLKHTVERAMPASIPASAGLPELEGIEFREILGAGAMGVVYRGEQSRPRREVAVKVMGIGIGTTAHSRRFRSEADALARLDHPGIARVYQAGVADVGRSQRPYLVMELVEGERLDRWLGSRGLTVRELLELMIEICDAVQHAHARGVIHRDLKPSNILVRTADGKPKVIDFGVARIEGSNSGTMATAAGEMVGTLAYMSPEQLGGNPAEVDTRSDVYALGVILFHMLSGELPLDVTSLSLTEAATAIQTSAPRRLASVAPSLRGDLDTITAHALEKDKERRYQTAEALRADIRRHLDGLPISARPPSSMYVLSRFAKRHRGPVAAASVLCVAIIAAGVVSARSAFIANRALAESSAAQVRLENINEFLVDDLLSAGHSMRLGVNARIADAIDEATPRIAERFAGDPVGEANVRQTVARMLTEGARVEEALEQLSLGAAALEASGLSEHREMVAIHFGRSEVLSLAGRLLESERSLREALALAERIELSADDPLIEVGRQLLASVLQNQGKYEEAEPLLRGIIADLEREGGDPQDLLFMYTQLYQIARVQGRDDERSRIENAIIRVAKECEDPTSLIIGTRFEGTKHKREGNLGLSLDANLRGLQIARRSVSPKSGIYRFAVLHAAESLVENERYEEAEKLAIEGFELSRVMLGDYHYDLEQLCGFTSRIYAQMGDADEARRWMGRMRILRFHIAGPGELASLRATVEESTAEFGSEESFFEALLTEEAALPPDSDQRPALLANVGRILAERDDARAESLLVRSFESLDLEDGLQRPEDVIQRLLDSLPPLLERGGRAAEADGWRGRLESARAGLDEPSQKN
jgi:tetratricopeptide (TPR) repeat protein